jgi:hypothetical protein
MCCGLKALKDTDERVMLVPDALLRHEVQGVVDGRTWWDASK